MCCSGKLRQPEGTLTAPKDGSDGVGTPFVSLLLPRLCGVGLMLPRCSELLVLIFFFLICHFASLGLSFPIHAVREGQGDRRMAPGLAGKNGAKTVTVLSKLELIPAPHPPTVPLSRPPLHPPCPILGGGLPSQPHSIRLPDSRSPSSARAGRERATALIAEPAGEAGRRQREREIIL